MRSTVSYSSPSRKLLRPPLCAAFRPHPVKSVCIFRQERYVWQPCLAYRQSTVSCRSANRILFLRPTSVRSASTFVLVTAVGTTIQEQ